MLKILFGLWLKLFILAQTFAQKDSTDKQILDSLIKNDDF